MFIGAGVPLVLLSPPSGPGVSAPSPPGPFSERQKTANGHSRVVLLVGRKTQLELGPRGLALDAPPPSRTVPVLT